MAFVSSCVVEIQTAVGLLYVGLLYLLVCSMLLKYVRTRSTSRRDATNGKLEFCVHGTITKKQLVN